MPIKRIGKRGISKSTSGRVGKSTNPAPNTIVYSGPCRTSMSRQERESFSTILTTSVNATASAGGVINSVMPILPTGASQWTGLANIYDEYRVLMLEVEYVPFYSSLPSTLVGGLMVMVLDHDSATALASFAVGTQYESFLSAPIDRRLKQHYRMSSTLEAEWINTSSPVNPGSVKSYVSNLSANGVYGTFIQTWRVQFRGKGV